MKLYVTFGQTHAHNVNGKTFDRDSVCEIECDNYDHGWHIASEAFDTKYFALYSQDEIKPKMEYFPRGIIPLGEYHV